MPRHDGSTRMWSPDASCATRVINGLFRTLRSVARRVFPHPAGAISHGLNETETQSQLKWSKVISDLKGQIKFAGCQSKCFRRPGHNIFGGGPCASVSLERA